MRISTIRVFILFLVAITGLSAKDKHKAAPKDEITVAAHITLTGGPVLRFTATRHFDRSYIYVERGAGQPVTLLDITDPHNPSVVSEMASGQGAANLIAAAGTSVLAGSSEPAGPSAQTIRIMDFSDPAHPKVTQEFDGVTAVEKVSSGVTLLANAQGVWVLTQSLAQDPKDDERYARKVIYGESLY